MIKQSKILRKRYHWFITDRLLFSLLKMHSRKEIESLNSNYSKYYETSGISFFIIKLMAQINLYKSKLKFSVFSFNRSKINSFFPVFRRTYIKYAYHLFSIFHRKWTRRVLMKIWRMKMMIWELKKIKKFLMTSMSVWRKIMVCDWLHFGMH